MSYFVDAHCHIDLFKNIRKDWRKEDLLPIKTISVTNAPFIYEACKSLFVDTKNIRVALGLHPELVNQYGNQIELFEQFIDSTKYIGEIGLDGSSQFKNSFEQQKKVFIEIIRLCNSRGKKILTIHTRNAATETLNLLNTYLKDCNCKVIFHWYSGTLKDLNVAIQRGYYFSINHKMTNTEKGRSIIASIPKHLLLTETDAPFTFGDTINTRLESLKNVVEKISIINGLDVVTIKNSIYENLKTLLYSVS